MVRGFERHVARFAAGLRQVGVTADVHAFVATAVGSIRDYVLGHGDAFPRFECWGSAEGPTLTVAIRPAPPRTTAVEFIPAVSPAADDSVSLKGPNIERYQMMSATRGGELLLTTANGIAIEGTTTSLVWWEGDTLMTVAPGPPRVQSVTESILIDIARGLGIETGTAHRTVSELLATELWAVNALHGIRPASSHRSSRLSRFTERYVATARPLAYRAEDRCVRSSTLR